MKIQLVRHATLLLSCGGKEILVDPLLAPAGAMPPISCSPNGLRNPLVDLPPACDPARLAAVDAILLTHTHQDHFDPAAAETLPKSIPVLCQPEDEGKLNQAGFSSVRPVHTACSWNGIDFFRTGGRHGQGLVMRLMGPVSGYVIKAPLAPLVYIAGDTVWCPEVEGVLEAYRPGVVVVFAGAARFVSGGPITMTAEDVGRVCRKAPRSRVMVVHMEAFNHCLLTRRELASYLERENLAEQVLVPGDGDWTEFLE